MSGTRIWIQVSVPFDSAQCQSPSAYILQSFHIIGQDFVFCFVFFPAWAISLKIVGGCFIWVWCQQTMFGNSHSQDQPSTIIDENWSMNTLASSPLRWDNSEASVLSPNFHLGSRSQWYLAHNSPSLAAFSSLTHLLTPCWYFFWHHPPNKTTHTQVFDSLYASWDTKLWYQNANF